jgi:hypothetical protein
LITRKVDEGERERSQEKVRNGENREKIVRSED